MMPESHIVHDTLSPVKTGPVTVHTPSPHRLAQPRSYLLILLSLACVAIPTGVAAGDFDPTENPWGFGYDGGLTLRRKLGVKWEVGISGGPNDYLSRTTEESSSETNPPSNTNRDLSEGDSRREGGFVAPHFGRTVWQRGAFDLVCYLRGVYQWSNRSDFSEQSRDGTNPRYDWSSWDRDERDWSLSLGFRPGYRPVSWFSIEVAFGLTYAWTKDSYRNDRFSDNGGGSSSHTVVTGETKGQTFTVFGYNGVSSFRFIVWF